MPTKELTYGLELEVVRLNDDAFEIMENRGFRRHFDRTIRGHDGEALPESIEAGGGTEVITPPLAVTVAWNQEDFKMQVDMRETFDVVRDLCRCAKEVNASCGLHVHLGRPLTSEDRLSSGDRDRTRSKWDLEQVRTMLRIGRGLEDLLFDRYVPSSRKNNQYCKKIGEDFRQEDFMLPNPLGQVVARKYDNTKRYCWLNLIETQRRSGSASNPALGTIEIRMLGNVRRVNYIWAWTKLWCKIGAIVAYAPTTVAIGQILDCNILQPELDEIVRVRTEQQKADKIAKEDKKKVIISEDLEAEVA
jgi:hypothetical protein